MAAGQPASEIVIVNHHPFPVSTMEDSESILQEKLPLMAGLWSGAVGLIAFALVGHTVFDDLTFGIIAGAVFAVGSMLFNPWFVELAQRQENTDESLTIGDWFRIETDWSPQLGMFGLGVELAGILIIAGSLAAEPPAPLAVLAIALAAGLATFTLGRIAGNRFGS